jgi:hypothetical protein
MTHQETVLAQDNDGQGQEQLMTFSITCTYSTLKEHTAVILFVQRVKTQVLVIWKDAAR